MNKLKQKREEEPSEESVKSKDAQDEITIEKANDLTRGIDVSGEVRSKTRVCIKLIPIHYNESQIKNHLLGQYTKQKLIITDVKLLRTPSTNKKVMGKSRGVAYVGLKDESMASHVVEFFDKTFMGSNRISVEFAFAPKCANQEGYRPWSKYTPGSSKYAKLHGDTNDVSKQDEPKKDQELIDEALVAKKKEFLSVMQSRTNTKLWSNDDGLLTTNVSKDNTISAINNPKESDEAKSDVEGDNQSTGSSDSGGRGADALRKLTDMDFLRSKATAKDDLEEVEEDDDHSAASSSVVSSTSEGSNESYSDESSGDEKPVGLKHEKVDSKSIDDNKPANFNEKDNNTSMDQDCQDDIGDSLLPTDLSPTRLFVRNLPFSATEEDLRSVFEPFGTVTECHIPCDDDKHNKGFAFVNFESANAASKALATLDRSDFQGRLMHLMPAKRPKDEIVTGNEEGLEGTYKAQKEQERKAKAGDMKGWSASFVRADAVVEGLADRLGLSKGDILNVTDAASGDAAVRLALGETHVVNENREYFAKHGISMDALISAVVGNSPTVKRSNSMILVKNLPYSTTTEELNTLFTLSQSAPSKVLLPPSRAIAAIEYSHPNEAKKAFRKLAYKRFKHVPLYLEWAPLAAIPTDVNPINMNVQTNEVHKSQESSVAAPTNSIDKAIRIDEEEEEFLEGDIPHSIYVKNLNFSTTEDTLKSLFEAVVKVHAVRIPMKTVAQKRVDGRVVESGEKTLSMGYGFVECKTANDAKLAMKKLQGKILDGHALELKLSKRESNSNKKITPSKKGGSKLIVRNVPFQATKTELLKLFGSFGQLKNVRMPKKFDGSHRGFAFVDYLTAQEAQAAAASLSKTHLYGRHLVLEWAEDKDDVDTLRQKAKMDLSTREKSFQPQNKKIRFE